MYNHKYIYIYKWNLRILTGIILVMRVMGILDQPFNLLDRRLIRNIRIIMVEWHELACQNDEI